MVRCRGRQPYAHASQVSVASTDSPSIFVGILLGLGHADSQIGTRKPEAQGDRANEASADSCARQLDHTSPVDGSLGSVQPAGPCPACRIGQLDFFAPNNTHRQAHHTRARRPKASSSPK
jgi:hypothetical protein